MNFFSLSKRNVDVDFVARGNKCSYEKERKTDRQTDRQTDRLNRRITTMKGMLRRKGKGKWHADMKE